MEQDFLVFALQMCLPSKKPPSSTVGALALGHQNRPTPLSPHHLVPTPVNAVRSQGRAWRTLRPPIANTFTSRSRKLAWSGWRAAARSKEGQRLWISTSNPINPTPTPEPQPTPSLLSLPCMWVQRSTWRRTAPTHHGGYSTYPEGKKPSCPRRCCLETSWERRQPHHKTTWCRSQSEWQLHFSHCHRAVWESQLSQLSYFVYGAGEPLWSTFNSPEKNSLKK